MQEVLIIGGGVVGASAAFHLAEAGVSVTLIDRQDQGHATAAGAGIIAPSTSLHLPQAFYSLTFEALGYYPELVEKLTELEAGDTRYEVVGKLLIAKTEAELDELPAIREVLETRYLEGMPNIGVTREVEATEAREMFPAVGDIAGAILSPEAARVDGSFLRNALVEGAIRLGARVARGDMRIVDATDTSVEVDLAGERSQVDRVIVATGAWSNAVLAPLGVSIPVEPQKGQIMHLSMDADTSRWPILWSFSDQYILTFGPNRVVCGATRETGSGYDLRVTPGGLQSVTGAALKVAPGLANATLEEVRVGLRPFSEDGLPFIDRVKGHEAVIVSTGHGPSGLQLGPWSGRLAAELAMGKDVSSDLSPFTLERARHE